MKPAFKALLFFMVFLLPVAGTGCPASTLPSATPTAQPTGASIPANATATISVETVVTNLDTPWAVAFAPDGRIFITERPGRIRVVENGHLLDEPWITLDVTEAGEYGLLGLTLDPDFAVNHFVYTAYTYRNAGGSLQNRLVRLREDPPSKTGTIDKVLIDGVNGSGNHDGGRVKFGPDGKLYWTMGDAGDSGSAQDMATLNGKILRLNPDGTIPADNPFPGSYVYSYGHRNPQGLAWQPETGRLYATEHGPSGFPGSGQDEVNLILPGNNYGWPLIIGNQTRQGMASPVIQSGTSDTWAPGGATFVTQGKWAKSLLFVGLRGQTLYRLVLNGENPALEKHLTGQFGRLRDVVEGPDGAIYILTSNRDGRGQPTAGDDRLLKLTIE